MNAALASTLPAPPMPMRPVPPTVDVLVCDCGCTETDEIRTEDFYRNSGEVRVDHYCSDCHRHADNAGYESRPTWQPEIVALAEAFAAASEAAYAEHRDQVSAISGAAEALNYAIGQDGDGIPYDDVGMAAHRASIVLGREIGSAL